MILEKSVRSCALAAVLLGAGGAASAEVIIGNLPNSPSDTGLGTIITGAETRSKAVGFSTPAGTPYELLSATFVMTFEGDSAEPGATPQVALWSDAGGNPGAQLAVLTNPGSLGTKDFYTFTAAAPIALDPSTTYWMLVNGAPTNTDPATDAFYWNSVSPSVTPAGVAGFDGYRFSSTATPPTGSSSVFNNFEIEARLVPAPASLAMLGFIGAAGARRRR